MDIASLYNTTATSASTQGTTKSKNSAMDAGNFMQMLMAQLTHQNPMEPMKDGEMMGQMAQLNSLQELQMIKLSIQEMATANQTSYAASLIGKVVQAEVDGETVKGKVTGITMESGKVLAHVGNQSFPLSDVTEIRGEE